MEHKTHENTKRTKHRDVLGVLRGFRVFRDFRGGLTVGVIVAGSCLLAVHAQESGRTVADGVYTDAQATRGAAVYEAACSGCHRADLGGATGPALKQQRFAQTYAGKDLRTLFTKIATTMPRNMPASLADGEYLDVVAHVLRENGFRAGTEDLTIGALDGIRVVAGQAKPLPPVGDFSYVEVVGCLTAREHTWWLTRASDPVAAVPSAAAASAPVPAAPLGAQSFHLVDASAYAPDTRRGQKVYVRGLLIKLPDEQRMTISALETVSPTCNE
jgi:cytochrome c5